MNEDVAPLRVPAEVAARPLVHYQRALLAGVALFLAVVAPLLPYSAPRRIAFSSSSRW